DACGGKRKRAAAPGARSPRPSACAARPRRPAPSWRRLRTPPAGPWLPASSGDLARVWRRRMGVEPTRDRLTAPPGFEVRSPHRERDSSVDWLRRLRREEFDARGIDAAQVLATDRKPVPVEKLQNLDRHL